MFEIIQFPFLVISVDVFIIARNGSIVYLLQ
jgi:hypothetical protein